jgi:hypothetical protein
MLENFGTAIYVACVIGMFIITMLAFTDRPATRFIIRWCVVLVLLGTLGALISATNAPSSDAEMPRLDPSKCAVYAWLEYDTKWVCVPHDQMG